MNAAIPAYISEFYPLIAGIIIFIILKSISLLKSKTMIYIEEQPAIPKYACGIAQQSHLSSIMDMPGDPNIHLIRCMYSYYGFRIFGNYITNSSEARSAAKAAILSDKFITDGRQRAKTGEKNRLTANVPDSVLMETEDLQFKEIAPNACLEIFAPEKALLLRCLLKPNPNSGVILNRIADYTLNLVN